MEQLNWPTTFAIVGCLASVFAFLGWLAWIHRDSEPYDPIDKTIERISKPLWTEVTIETRPEKRDEEGET